MLQGRIAPPCSPAVGPGDSNKAPQQPQPMSRRNSFSRDVAAMIHQQRTRPTEGATLDGIQLHVNDSFRPLSPRKSASFSLPKTPRKDDVDAQTNARVLRPTLSEYQLRPSSDGEEMRGAVSSRSSLALVKDDVYLGDEVVEVLTLDSPVKIGESSQHEDENESYSENSSPATSSYSPLSPTNDGEHDDDAFESWLLDARVLESPVPAQRPATDDWPSKTPAVPVEQRVAEPQAGERTPPWLQAQRSPPIELSKSVQQIEHEIRHAIDSAASRVTSDMQRRDDFQHSIQSAVGSSVASAANDLAKISPPPAASGLPSAEELELLLLMEVLIGDGRSESIEVHLGDKPELLAEAFAYKHGLGADAIPRLAQHIQDQLDALDEEEVEEESGQEELSRDDQERRQLGPSHHHTYGEEAEEIGEDPCADYRLDEYESSSFMPPPAPTSARYDDRERYHTAPPATHEEKLLREYEREHSYRHLMEKYGHYTSHSNKVNPTHSQKHDSSRHVNGSDAGRAATSGSGRSPAYSNDQSEPLTMQNVEHARLLFTPRPVTFGSSTKSGGGKEKETVYNRLYSLAEAREKWIRRQQKAKAADEIKERQSQMKLEISAKSRDMIAGRGNGGYAHIGERLYDEALSDLAKKRRESEKRAIERQQEVDWTCPKCAFVNQHSDAVCKNIVASLPPPPSTSTSSSNGPTTAFEATYNPATTMALLDAHPEVVCGYARPQQLFRPTLIAGASTSNTTTQSVQATKLRGSSVSNSSLSNQSQRRQRTQQQMEDEFRQTCPFKTKINDMSEEIMRDKLEQEAKARGGRQASVTTTTTGEVRRKNPHKELYEDAFHARAHREAKEQEYMAQFTFKPNIGVNALWSDNRGEEDVVERLAVVRYQELERKRTSLHTKYAPDRDPTTGREYFKPEVGRAPIFNRNERGLPIGEFLYEAHKEHAEYHRRLRQQETDEVKRQSEQGFLSDKSKHALHQRKKKTFARLFDCLLKLQPPPGDCESTSSEPRVVPGAVNVAQLPPEIARVVSIVFEFANDEAITFTQFEQFMDKLMTDVPGLTCTQILFLTESLSDGKSARRSVDKAALQAEEEDEETAELTFRPAIDKNSAAMAKKHGRAERAKVFEALNQYYDHYKDRADQARKQREREFARTHPFQPTFYTKDRKTKATSFYDKLHRSEMLAPTTATTSKSQQAESTAPSLRTAVPNARPFVRPIPTDEASRHDRSRANSIASSKHSDDEDAALTSRVLAALDDRPASQPQFAAGSTSSTAFSAIFSASSSSAVSMASSAAVAEVSTKPQAETMSLSELAM